MDEEEIETYLLSADLIDEFSGVHFYFYYLMGDITFKQYKEIATTVGIVDTRFYDYVRMEHIRYRIKQERQKQCKQSESM